MLFVPSGLLDGRKRMRYNNGFPAWSPLEPVVPYDKHGNMLHYPTRDSVPKDGQPFDASMTLVSMERGRSAAFFWFKDELGHTFPMFMTDLTNLLKGPGIVYGKTSHITWTYSKRGTNYGIKHY